jgi:hypothetical protein
MKIFRNLGRTNEADEQEALARKLMKKENEYNQACFEALCGNTEKALVLLRIGLEKKQVTKAWAHKDTDLENLHADARCKGLVAE